jgi:hypothetical protein
MQLLKYQKTDGQVVAMWSANLPDIVVANIIPDDHDYGYLLTATDLSIYDIQAGYVVHENALVPNPSVQTEKRA